MGDRVKLTSIWTGAAVTCLSLCLSSAAVLADDTVGTTAAHRSDALGLITDGAGAIPADVSPFSLALDRQASGLDFDLGGSDTRKLQLVLDQPLMLSTGTRGRALDSGSNLLGLDATLSVPVTERFNLTAGAERETGTAHFQSLGSIRCSNGTLRADSYTASGCRFVNEPMATSDRKRLDLGAQLNVGSASASISWFTQTADLDQSGPRALSPIAGHTVLGDNLLSPNLGNPLLSASTGDPLRYLNSETSGVDLNFKVGITTDNHGDIRLGLAFSRVLEADYQGLYANSGDAMSWTLAAPFNTARMNLEWSRGAFSGGIQGFYRDSVDFLDRNNLDGLTTFDVHFTWRTPWNANFSVGASNVLSAGAEPAAGTDATPVDPLESIYGRIPYVRYKQDL
jgi:hypothetical protein